VTAGGRETARLFALVGLCVAGCGASGPGTVGAVLGRDNETRALHVREVPAGLAAEQAGLLAGDEIVMIDGLYVKDLAAADVRAKLRGEPGSTVDLTVVRGDQVKHVKVTRGAMRERRPPPPREERIAE
jgi:carboxyl-terminal processing protease